VTCVTESNLLRNRFLLPTRLLLMIVETFLSFKMSITVIASDTCICNNTRWTLMAIFAVLITELRYIITTAFNTSHAHVPFSERSSKIVYHMMFLFVIK
jgi:hypothetical protein